MDTSSNAILQAKRVVVNRLSREAWLVGVGVGLAEGAPAVVVSVEPGQRAAAERAVLELGLGVPVRVREVGEIRPRAAPRRGRARRAV